MCRTVLHSFGWDGLGDAACMGWAESCTQDVGQRAFLFACQIVDFLFFPETNPGRGKQTKQVLHAPFAVFRLLDLGGLGGCFVVCCILFACI